MNPPTIATFSEWVKSTYSLSNRHGDDISVDRLLERDMLEGLGGSVTLRRDFYDDFLITAIERASSRLESFVKQAEEIRNRPYNFDPSDPAVPSFLEFCSETFPGGITIPAHQKSALYDAYATAISGIATSQTLTAFEISRERRTEGDRRELYGLSRQPNTQALQQLNAQRNEVREVILQLEEYDQTAIALALANEIRSLLYEQIRVLRCFIASERRMAPEHDARLQGHLRFLRDRLSGVSQITARVEALNL